MYIIDRIAPNYYLIKLYAPNNRIIQSFECYKYINALKFLQSVGIELKDQDRRLLL